VGALAIGVLAGRPGRVALVVLIGVAIGFVGFGGSLERRLHQQFADPTDRPAWVPSNVAFRYRLWTQQYFPVLDGKWLTGYGPDLPPEVRFPYTESLYMTLLLRGAVPLVAVYFLLMAALLGAAVRARNDPEPERRIIGRALAVGIVLLLPMHFIEPYFILVGGSHLVWILAAVTLSGGPPARAPAPARRSALRTRTSPVAA
jgi:hypothetical protein